MALPPSCQCANVPAEEDRPAARADLQRSLLAQHDVLEELRFDQFLRQELDELHERLVRRYAEQAEFLPSARAADRMPKVADRLDPLAEEMALLSETTERAPSPTTIGNPVLERWASMVEDLCYTGPDEEDGEEYPAEPAYTDVHDAPVYKHQLQLREAWKLSYHAALRRGRRKRTNENSLTLGIHHVETIMAESCLQRFVFSPEHRFQLIWALLSGLLIVWDLITLPLQFFYLGDLIYFLDYVAIASLAFWIADMPLRPFFGVATTTSIVEMRPWVLARRYAKTWFVVDLLILGVDCFVLFMDFSISAAANPLLHSGRLVRMMRLLRLVRLLRVVKLEKQTKFVVSQLLSTNSLLLVKVTGGFAVMMAINHVIACLWYGVGFYTSDLGNWLERSDIDGQSFTESYVASLHWSMAQFTSATNPIAPSNGYERLFAIFVILMAVASFSSFVSSIGSTISSMRAARRGKILERAKLELFFTERQLSLSLFSKIKDSVRDDDRELERISEEEVSLIQGIPERFKVELHKEIFMESLLRVDIWPVWVAREEPDFLNSVCHLVMKEHWARAGQDVFLPRSKCQMVYLLQSGDLEYVDDEPKTKYITAEGGHEDEVMSLPNLWAEWVHTTRLTARSGICRYAGIDCKQFCTLATDFGGRICEYLKVLGILLLGEIEALEAQNIRVTDLCVPGQVHIEGLAERAEKYASLKAKATQEAYRMRSAAAPLTKFWQA